MPKKIMWTDEEWDAVALAMAKHLINNPGTTLPSAYRSVSGCLPKNRVRSNVNANHHFDVILDKIKRYMKESQSPPKVETKVQVESSTIYVPVDLGEISTANLLEEIENRRTKKIVDSIKPLLLAHTGNPAQQVISALELEKEEKANESKPRVAVIGLVGQLQNKLKDKFGSYLDMRFDDAESDASPSKIDGIVSSCDFVVLSRFISHSHQAVVKRHKVPVAYCPGGYSGIAKMIEERYPMKTNGTT